MANHNIETPNNPSYRFAARALNSSHASHAAANDLVELSGGYAFPRCLPDISMEAGKAAAAHRTETMQYSDVLGLEELRDQIVDYVAADGIVCARDNVMVVNGAKHGLDLACRVFIEPGDAVIVTAPTYMTALSILRTHEADFWAIPQDEQGMQADVLEQRLAAAQSAGDKLPKLLFDVPDFHNPTGITTSLERRHELIRLARRFGFVIIEDDPYRRIRFEGEAVPPMKSLDESGVVIALGTASKILAPGMRIGWVIASASIIERMAAHKADGGTSPFNQRIFLELLAGNQVAHHIAAIIRQLRIHRDMMVDELRRHLPEASVHVPQGGYFLWVELPDDIDADMLAGLAIKKGVKTYSGRLSYPLEPSRNALRLCYSYEEPERIRQGVEALGEAFASLRTGEVDSSELEALADASLKLQTF
ncbi:2-aminoadipate transaminase [Aquamicrobium lusatiense]|uniref:2-aminoadipate transaminase n=1 Tax=Aquamicrobium lusatiense TaxID=89772 RepID=A0A7W9S810_9HYPH|nr:PLP-dependent aminotransferase family protein [Aquamicrobium lusatiense]MBB6014743.1 2-aminoadipate transaminase [Aquamicrobium lusatiense]